MTIHTEASSRERCHSRPQDGATFAARWRQHGWQIAPFLAVGPSTEVFIKESTKNMYVRMYVIMYAYVHAYSPLTAFNRVTRVDFVYIIPGSCGNIVLLCPMPQLPSI